MLEQDYEILGGDAAGWMADARCAEYSTSANQWFDKAGWAAAKRICTGCAVQAECLSYAISEDITAGIWGGADPGERRALVKDGYIDARLIGQYGHRAVQGREAERERYRDALWEQMVAARMAES